MADRAGGRSPILEVQGHVNSAVQCHLHHRQTRSPVKSIGAVALPHSTNSTIITSLSLHRRLPD